VSSARRLLALLPAFLLAPGAALAQKTTGEVRGTVTDPSGAIVPTASVTMTNRHTGYVVQRAVDGKGEFVFPLLQPGDFRLEVTADGFKRHVGELVVRALETTSVPVRLEVGPIAEEIVVRTATNQVDVSSGGVTQRLTRDLLGDFPNLNRYGFANASLMPAVSQSTSRPEVVIASIAGNPTDRNSFYIDGAEATDPWVGWSPRQPVVDAFDEIVVSTAGATADTGSNLGGTYNAILKSGSNTFHGGAWYFFRDEALNANSWQNNTAALPKPDDVLKYWGAQVGGPILEDKLFFYVTAHRETDQQAFSVTGHKGPTAAMVGGDFSAVPFTIYDPDTRQPFPGNVIPRSRIDPVATNFWEKYGFTVPAYGDTHDFQFVNPRSVWNFNGRLDYEISRKHRLSASGYSFSNTSSSPDRRVQGAQGFAGETFGPDTFGTEVGHYPQTLLSLRHTWMAQPNFFVETHGAWSSMREVVSLDGAGLGTTLETLGANDPLPRAGAPELLPTMIIGQWWGSPEGQTTFNGWTTDNRVHNLTFGTSATWIEGSHSLKFGAEFQRGSSQDVAPAKPADPGIDFNGTATAGGQNPTPFAYGFADFLLGRFGTYPVTDQHDITLSSWSVAGYAMDQWRVTSRLTVTPGLRYELTSQISEKDGKLTVYRPGLQSTLLPKAPPGIVIAGDPGVPDSLVDSGWGRLQPRLNAAFDLTGDGKTALRGSVGLYSGRDVLLFYGGAFAGKPPFASSSAVARGGILSDPWLTSQSPTYGAPPFPFTDQDPADFDWGSQTSGISGLDPGYRLPSSWQWNLAVERELLSGVRLELGYQGNRSTDQPAGIPTNLAVFEPGATDDPSNVQERRPNQLFGDNLLSFENEGRARYDQLLLLARVRRANVLAQLSWAYTHARRNTSLSPNRTYDQAVDFPGTPTLMTDAQNNHTVAGFVVWDLPILRHDRGAWGNLLGGWSVAANGSWSFWNEGQTVFLGYDANANGYFDDLADVVAPVSYPRTPLQGQGDLLYQWFDPSAFAYPGGGTERAFSPTSTYAGNNAIGTLPSFWSFDASLLKDFRLRGAARLQLRFECYNLFNHANLNWPINNFSDPNFGKIKGKYGDGRRMQLGLRLRF
jgi:hypothetical protein